MLEPAVKKESIAVVMSVDVGSSSFVSRTNRRLGCVYTILVPITRLQATLAGLGSRVMNGKPFPCHWRYM